MDKLIQKSFVSALGVVAYVAVVVTIMSSLEDKMGEGDTILMPIMFLTLFVLSAAITGALVLGKPIMMYMGGQKIEAMKLFAYTVGWLAVAVVVLLLINLNSI